MLATTCLQHRFWWLHLTISFDDCWHTVGSALLDGTRGLLNARGACDFQYGPFGNRTVGSPLPLSSTALEACSDARGSSLAVRPPPRQPPAHGWLDFGGYGDSVLPTPLGDLLTLCRGSPLARVAFDFPCETSHLAPAAAWVAWLLLRLRSARCRCFTLAARAPPGGIFTVLCWVFLDASFGVPLRLGATALLAAGYDIVTSSSRSWADGCRTLGAGTTAWTSALGKRSPGPCSSRPRSALLSPSPTWWSPRTSSQVRHADYLPVTPLPVPDRGTQAASRLARCLRLDRTFVSVSVSVSAALFPFFGFYTSVSVEQFQFQFRLALFPSFGFTLRFQLRLFSSTTHRRSFHATRVTILAHLRLSCLLGGRALHAAAARSPLRASLSAAYGRVAWVFWRGWLRTVTKLVTRSASGTLQHVTPHSQLMEVNQS